MMIVQIAAIAIITTILSIILKQYKPEYAVVVQLMAGVVIFFLMISSVADIINEIKNLFQKTGINSNYVLILVKALGICIITQFASDSCKDAGEHALASQVELAGKITVLVLSLPLIKVIMSIAVGLIKG